MNELAPMPAVLQHDADAWAVRINASWRRSLESVIETGRLLVDAKEQLAKHGTWLPMVETMLDFSPDQAQRLMAIARDQRLTNTAHLRFLPRTISTLHELTKVSDSEFDRGVRENIIRPDMERADVALLRPHPVLESSSAVEQGAVNALAAGSIPASPATIDAGEPPETGRAARGTEAYSPREVELSGGSPAPMPSGGLAIAHRRDESDDDPREFFPTPPWATRALIEHVLRHLNREGHCKFQNAWEPACGEGHMAEVLREYFRDVAASDAYDYEYRGDNADIFKYDFLTGAHASAENFDWIITNPPFRKSTDFVLKAIALARTGVAMFVRLSWIEGVTRYEKLLRDDPPSLLSIFTERAPLHKARWEPDGSTFTAYAWLVWIKNMPPQPPFWIPPGCRVALSKPEDIKKFGKAIVEGEAA